MIKRISRDFDVLINGTVAYQLKGKAHSIVDGMGTRIINHDGTTAFSMSGTNVSVVETNSTEEEVEETQLPNDPVK